MYAQLFAIKWYLCLFCSLSTELVLTLIRIPSPTLWHNAYLGANILELLHIILFTDIQMLSFTIKSRIAWSFFYDCYDPIVLALF